MVKFLKFIKKFKPTKPVTYNNGAIGLRALFRILYRDGLLGEVPSKPQISVSDQISAGVGDGNVHLFYPNLTVSLPPAEALYLAYCIVDAAVDVSLRWDRAAGKPPSEEQEEVAK